jgi:hypothetical protein
VELLVTTYIKLFYNYIKNCKKVEKLKFQKFNINTNIKFNSKIIIVGDPREISVLQKDILFQHYQNYSVGLIMNNDDDSLNQLVPPLFVHATFIHKIFNGIVKYQKNAIANQEKGLNNAFIIVNITDNEQITRSRTHLDIKFILKKMNVLMLMTMKFNISFNCNLLKTIDHVFIGNELNIIKQYRLWDKYGRWLFQTFRMFRATLIKLTQNGQYMVINKHQSVSNIENVVFWYKPEVHPTFRIGISEFWDFKQ